VRCLCCDLCTTYVLRCIQYSPDSEGINGIYLGKDVVTEASKGLEKVITQIAPKVLSYKQIAAFVLTEIGRRFNRRMKKYSPSFENCIDHVLIHAGPFSAPFLIIDERQEGQKCSRDWARTSS